MSEGINKWLSVSRESEDVFKTSFSEHHLGNTFIRSLHGGVSGSLIELSAETFFRGQVDDSQKLSVITSTIDYMRVTKDRDLYCRVTLIRKSRRVAVIDAVCWQDDEAVHVARGSVTLKITSS